MTSATHKPARRYTLNPLRWPLYLRVLLGVLVGGSLGMWRGRGTVLPGVTTGDLGTLAGFYIQVLTAMATPLIFFAIVEAFVQTNISGRQGVKMFAVCALNIVVAFSIGLTILNVWEPGRTWSGTLAERARELNVGTAESQPGAAQDLMARSGEVSLSPLEIIRSYVPRSVAQPFTDNMVLTVAVMAILIGAAMRALKHTHDEQLVPPLETFERLIVACFQILLKILFWLIELAPFAICFAVAGVVGATGTAVFELVGIFFVMVVACLALHAVLYYPLSAWLIGGKSPRLLFGKGAGAILTGFSINSSLATAPLTLEALRKMGVSESSARLSACVGTNFNNDGITLYEAITALFIAQAAGLSLGVDRQVGVLLAALAGSMGIAGIPNSGLIILALVLKAARLPEEIVHLALPLVYSVDFINARLRSAVNVLGDMQVAILLDAGCRSAPPPPPP